MGRIVTILLVLIVVGLGIRVLFVDARDPDDLGPAAAEPSVKPVVLPQSPAAATPPADAGAGIEAAPPEAASPEAAPIAEPAPPKITIVDPDPDLDDNTDPPDCQGTPEQPVAPKPDAQKPDAPKPDSPAPH